jgi:hypothetical protein
LDIHKNRFADEWNVALVLDPVKHEGGFFAWVDGNINPRERLDFYELLDGDSRETVVAWTNYVAEDPKTGVPAPLKAVNTQNSDGESPVAALASQRSSPILSDGVLSNPYAVIGGAAVLLLLLGTVLAGYWMFFRNSVNTANTSNSENQIVKNKVLNGDKIWVSKDLKGFIASDNKLTVDLQITGIGETDVIEEIRKDNNLQVEINGQATTLTSETVNGSILKARAVTPLTAEMTETFNADKPQEFVMNVYMFYNSDIIEKKVETKFQKGKGANPTPSLGVLVAFGEVKEKNITSPKKIRKAESSDKPKPGNDNDKQQPSKVDNNPATKRNSPQNKTTTTDSSKTDTEAAITDGGETNIIEGTQRKTKTIIKNTKKGVQKETIEALPPR